MAKEFNFPGFYKGDKINFLLSFNNDDNTPFTNLSAHTYQLQVKKYRTDPDPIIEFNSTGDTINIDENSLIFYMPSSELQGLKAGLYSYDLQEIDDQNDILTIIWGEFPILQDVTR